jgi:hypothetical protein
VVLVAVRQQLPQGRMESARLAVLAHTQRASCHLDSQVRLLQLVLVAWV